MCIHWLLSYKPLPQKNVLKNKSMMWFFLNENCLFWGLWQELYIFLSKHLKMCLLHFLWTLLLLKFITVNYVFVITTKYPDFEISAVLACHTVRVLFLYFKSTKLENGSQKYKSVKKKTVLLHISSLINNLWCFCKHTTKNYSVCLLIYAIISFCPKHFKELFRVFKQKKQMWKFQEWRSIPQPFTIFNNNGSKLLP